MYTTNFLSLKAVFEQKYSKNCVIVKYIITI